MKQYHILFVHTSHKCVLRQGICMTGILFIRSFDLLIERLVIYRQETLKLVIFPFAGSERGAFIQIW
jgi:hypothetical protein